MKVWRANRSLHYVTTAGESVVVYEGQILEDASDELIATLQADGFIREGRTNARKEDG